MSAKSNQNLANLSYIFPKHPSTPKCLVSAQFTIWWRKQTTRILFEFVCGLLFLRVSCTVLEAFFGPLIKRPLFPSAQSLRIFCKTDTAQISKVKVLCISMSKEEFLRRQSFLSKPASINAVERWFRSHYIYSILWWHWLVCCNLCWWLGGILHLNLQIDFCVPRSSGFVIRSFIVTGKAYTLGLPKLFHSACSLLVFYPSLGKVFKMQSANTRQDLWEFTTFCITCLLNCSPIMQPVGALENTVPVSWPGATNQQRKEVPTQFIGILHRWLLLALLLTVKKTTQNTACWEICAEKDHQQFNKQWDSNGWLIMETFH